MMHLSDQELEIYLKEDVPSFDLTTWVMDIGTHDGEMHIKARENGIVCGSEEAKRVCEKLGLTVKSFISSGETIQPEDEVLHVKGKASDLHQAWKVSVNILENMSGIATRTRDMVNEANGIGIVSTRKIMPGTRNLATKAVLMGGGHPHRLGLSESILIFEEHRAFVEKNETIAMLKKVKQKSLEKKVLIEVKSQEEALDFALHVDVLQCDKFSIELLTTLVPKLKEINPNLVITAAGGINATNANAYAKTGVDLLVSSSMYWGKPLDFGVSIKAR